MKLGCFGDAHVGAWLQYAENRLAEQEAVLARAVEIFNDEGVDAILFAGDATHRNKPTPAELFAFTRPLLGAHAPILAINGNAHDVISADQPIALELLDRELYGAIRGSGVLRLSRTPEVLELGEAKIATLPWAPVSRLVAARNGGERDDVNAEAAAHLLSIARGLRAQCGDAPCVLLGHWSVSGAALPSGLPIDIAREPILDLGELEAMEWDAIVLGHVHKPQMLTGVDATSYAGGSFFYGEPIFYVGSPLPLNFGEADTEHGVWILDLPSGSSTVGSAPGFSSLQPGDAGSTPASRFIPIESRRFVTLDVDFQHYAPGSQLPTRGFTFNEEASDAIVKLRYHATAEQARQIDEQALRRALEDAGAHRVYIERVPVAEQRRVRVEGLDEHLDAASALELWLASGEVAPEQAAAIRERHEAYTRELAGAAN